MFCSAESAANSLRQGLRSLANALIVRSKNDAHAGVRRCSMSVHAPAMQRCKEATMAFLEAWIWQHNSWQSMDLDQVCEALRNLNHIVRRAFTAGRAEQLLKRR